MFFFQQFSGVQNCSKSMTIFMLYKHKLTNETMRILVILRTMKCRALALMMLRNENSADGGDVIILGSTRSQGDPNSKYYTLYIVYYF